MIKISNTCTDDMKVKVKLSWKESGVTGEEEVER